MRRIIALAALVAIIIITAIALRRGQNATTAEAAVPVDSLSSPAAPGSAEPNLATAPDGRVYMSWLEPRDSGHALRFAVLDGTRWSPVRTIREGRDFFVNWADFPSIVVLDEGRLAAHWLQRSGAGTYAYGVRVAQSTDSGATWGEAAAPHRDSSPTEHGFVALWQDGQRLGTAWLDGRNFAAAGHDSTNEMMLLATTTSADGMFGAEASLDLRTCDCCQTSAAMTAEGPVVAYRDRSPDEIRDIYVVRRVGERWTAGAPVHRDGWRVDFCPVNGPAIAAAGRRVAVAWFTAANDTSRVKVAFSDDAGATFSPPIAVDDGNPAGRVDVELLRDGSALVTWIERISGETAAVRVRRVAGDGTVGRATTVASSSASRASGFPRVTITGDDAVFAWTVPGQPSQVRVARARVASFR